MDFSTIQDAATQESSVIYKVLAAGGGLLAGVGAAMAWGMSWTPGAASALGAVGPQMLGIVNAHQTALALLMLGGGLAGAAAGFWAWLGLARLLAGVCPLPAAAALKRAAFPFVAFLPLITFLLQGRPVLAGPAALFLALAVGWIIASAAERKDKRKIFFAFPTESEYEPSSLFAHGAVMVLGACIGWYLQSLPSWAHSPLGGLWFPALMGAGYWIAAQGLASLLGFLYTKHTFNQIFLGVALSALPLALLPLQSLSWAGYELQGVVTGAFHWGAVPAILAVTAGVASPAVLVLALLKLSPRPVETQPAWEELFRAMMLVTAIPLLLVSAAYAPAGSALGQAGLAGPLDFLREGETLASAQAVLMGRLPFKEILFRHGFLSDAVTGLAALGWFGGTAEGLRLVSAWLVPLGLAGIYYLGIFCLPWMWVLVLMVALISGKLGMVGETRFFFAYAGFVFTFLYLQRERWLFLIGSGLATVLALVASYSAGLMAVVGHGALLAAYLLAGPAANKRRWLGLALYAGAVALGLLPWWLYLGLSGSLGDYFRNFGWVLSQAQAAFALPLPGWGEHPTLLAMALFILPPGLVAVGLWTLVASFPKAKERGLPWNVLLLTVVVFLLWLRFAQRGQMEFLYEALPVSALLAGFFIYRWSAPQAFWRQALLGALALWAFAPYGAGSTLPEVAGGFGAKNLVSTAGLAVTKLPALGKLALPSAQAQATEELTTFLDGQVGSTETFFDFSNQPMLYFLVPRRPVVPALTTAALVTWAQQQDAIERLSEARVKAVVFGTQPEQEVGGVPSELRQYAVCEYLLSRFTPVAVKGRSVILGPREENPSPDSAAAAALQRPLDLKNLPLAWGGLSKYDPGAGTGAGTITPADGAKSVDPAGVTVTVSGELLTVAPAKAETTLRLSFKPDPAKRVNVVLLQLKTAPAAAGATAVLAWGDKASGRRVSFTLGSGSQTYVLRVGALPSWTLAGEVSAAQLTLPGGDWTWEKGRLLAVADIPQIKPAAAAPAPAPAAGAVKPGKAEAKKK